MKNKKNIGFTLMNKTSERSERGFTLMNRTSEGFTLIELLVVVSIIGILIGLSFFGLQGAREASRDGKRKTDMEQLRSGLEIYKADCNAYPAGTGNVSNVLARSGNSLTGDGSISSCATSNSYISNLPTDPLNPTRIYVYSSNGTSYEICTSLEQITTGTLTCGGISSCGGSPCNYRVTNP